MLKPLLFLFLFESSLIETIDIERAKQMPRLIAERILNLTHVEDSLFTTTYYNKSLTFNYDDLDATICNEKTTYVEFTDLIYIFSRRFINLKVVDPTVHIIENPTLSESQTFYEFNISFNLTNLMNYMTTVKLHVKVHVIAWSIEKLRIEGGCVESGAMNASYIYPLGDTELESTNGHDFMIDTYENFLFLRSLRNAKHRLTKNFEARIDFLAEYYSLADHLLSYNKDEFIMFLNNFLSKYEVRHDLKEYNGNHTGYQMIVEEVDHVVFKCTKFIEYFGNSSAIDLWEFQIEATNKQDDFWEIDRVFMTVPKYMWFDTILYDRSREEFFIGIKQKIIARFTSAIANDFETITYPKKNCTEMSYKSTLTDLDNFYNNLIGSFINYTRPITMNGNYALPSFFSPLFNISVFYDNNGISQKVDLWIYSSYSMKFDTHEIRNIVLNCPTQTSE